MQAQEVTVNGNRKLKVVLKDDAKLLQETVIVGYGQQKKASVVGAIATMELHT